MKILAAAALMVPLAGAAAGPDLDALRRQVEATERAFAKTMADRDHAAFSALLSEQALFWSPQLVRGRAAVAAAWKPFYEGPKAPFSWEPDQVEVLGDGTLAHSTGPVRDAEGRVVSRFASVWRQEAPGVWRIVFDKGQPLSAADRERYGVKP